MCVLSGLAYWLKRVVLAFNDEYEMGEECVTKNGKLFKMVTCALATLGAFKRLVSRPASNTLSSWLCKGERRVNLTVRPFGIGNKQDLKKVRVAQRDINTVSSITFSWPRGLWWTMSIMVLTPQPSYTDNLLPCCVAQTTPTSNATKSFDAITKNNRYNFFFFKSQYQPFSPFLRKISVRQKNGRHRPAVEWTDWVKSETQKAGAPWNQDQRRTKPSCHFECLKNKTSQRLA